MTEQEIEQYAKDGWNEMHIIKNEPWTIAGSWTEMESRNNWDYYLQGMKDAVKVMLQQGYPESALKSSWGDGYSKGHSQGLLYDMPECATHGTYEDWLKQYNATQQKEQ